MWSVPDSAIVRLFWQYQNFVHHAEIFMQQDVAMEHKRTGNCGIAKIHAHLYAMVRMAGAFPERNLDGVAQILICNWLSVHFQHFEVNLVDVKGVCLKRAILYDPVFDGANVSGDHGLFIRLQTLFVFVRRR